MMIGCRRPGSSPSTAVSPHVPASTTVEGVSPEHPQDAKHGWPLVTDKHGAKPAPFPASAFYWGEGRVLSRV